MGHEEVKIPTTIDDLGHEILSMKTEDIIQKSNMINAEVRILKSETSKVFYEIQAKKDAIKENQNKIKSNNQLPYLVGIFQEKLGYEEGHMTGVVSSSQRSSSYLKMLGMVDEKDLLPGDLVAVHKETNVIFEKLPRDFDVRVKSMELDERPQESYEDIGGLERQIEELNEAIVLPFLHPESFKALNIRPPKGVLMYGPPGTGKTLMARACAAKTSATFLKLAGPHLVQMYIGDGARLVRDAFALAKEKKPAIIFIDEIDAIGTKRVDSDRTGDREVQRTMLELLNQLDGFSENDDVKVIAATNRIDILDAALLRSGRLDRKIEFPLPNVDGRKRIMQIHARKMSVHSDVNFEELARSTEGFNGAQLKAVCVEAGVCAMRKNQDIIYQIDFMDGLQEVLSKKKSNLEYFT
ncbi:26S protease regulatory subunit 6A [Edhazardia aedis USNM 41457]|uniref:26S proteasome regulatory subunit 6A n=1 Tax=Edhazardia aedis (strain USNM 41457) TaxID=1003232 RepID=J9DCC2_EDHAE|nr:26S protease regulatory subunit 6A [Edhazardia aedis USNM 41457]|eukprot:EJW05391.1 26S protease regulatory subunit 6A [Edhazardia aedis USNM 41457]